MWPYANSLPNLFHGTTVVPTPFSHRLGRSLWSSAERERFSTSEPRKDQVKNGGLSLNSLAVFGNATLSGNANYLNFGTTAGITGYGIRNNNGILEFKNNGGNWAGIGSGSGALTDSGSVDYVVKWTGGTTLGNSTIPDDGSPSRAI